MKVIFLDIDGVLITSRHSVLSKRYLGKEFDPVCVTNLRRIIEVTGASIVVSSSLRIGRTFQQLTTIFSENAIEKGLVGQTPVLKHRTRWEEIMMYIDEVKGTSLEVEHFVIIDDEINMGPLEQFHVWTDYQTGITGDTVQAVNDYFH